jgi:hypothetical protein
VRICFERLESIAQDSTDASAAHTATGAASPSTMRSANDS